jgi:hypothetical protein
VEGNRKIQYFVGLLTETTQACTFSGTDFSIMYSVVSLEEN